jgi:hypothetical protein
MSISEQDTFRDYYGLAAFLSFIFAIWYCVNDSMYLLLLIILFTSLAAVWGAMCSKNNAILWGYVAIYWSVILMVRVFKMW